MNSVDAIKNFILENVQKYLRDKEKEFGPELTTYLMKVVMLQAIDTHWKEHLLSMDHLREGIGLRGYGQKDPVREYQREGYAMFMEMISRIKMDTLEKLCLVRIQREEEVEEIRQKQKQDYVLSRGEDTPLNQTVKRESEKIGRNDPCPCGSGKKYKKCCGA
jgi:preprotein translocase subunit SecA